MAYSLVLVLIPAAFLLSHYIHSRIALPVLTGIGVYFPFVLEIQKSLWHGLSLLSFWVVLQSMLVLALTWRNREKVRDLVWRAEEYTENMFAWIDTGHLPEGNRRAVILFHLRQAFVYCLLAAATANLISLMLGSALLNYMNYYVARFALASPKQKVKALSMGWNPWSIVRVATFLYLGTVVALPALSLLFAVEEWPSFALLAPGLGGLILDLLLKLSISPAWSRNLKKLLTY